MMGAPHPLTHPEPHPIAEARLSIYGEPPTMPDIDRRDPRAPRTRPEWWPRWWWAFPELIRRWGAADEPPLTREAVDIGDYA